LHSVPSRSGLVRNGMICLGSSSPSLGSNPPLYPEVGWVHGSLGRRAYCLHAPESRRVLQRRSMDRGDVVEPKKLWASSGYSVLTLCVSSCVGLDRPLPSAPSGDFLVVKEAGSRG
jgi:hypothetical protein